MAILDYFNSSEKLAENLELNDEDIILVWKEYIETVKEKNKLISNLSLKNIKSSVEKLRALLDLELIDISRAKEIDEEMIGNFNKLKDEEKLRRLHRLESCLGYEATRYDYLNKLLAHLYQILQSESNSINNLEENPKEEINNLQSLYIIELEIIKKTEKFGKYNQRVETFQKAFLSLVTGEKIIRRINEKKKKLYKRMAGMKKIFSTDEAEQINEGMTHAWVSAVFNAIEEKVEEAIEIGILEGYNPDIDF